MFCDSFQMRLFFCKKEQGDELLENSSSVEMLRIKSNVTKMIIYIEITKMTQAQLKKKKKE